MACRNRLRVGAVNYLNTKPLVYRLDRLAPRAEVMFDLPSRLADRSGGRRAGCRTDSVGRIFSGARLSDRFECLHCLPRTGAERETV